MAGAHTQGTKITQVPRLVSCQVVFGTAHPTYIAATDIFKSTEHTFALLSGHPAKMYKHVAGDSVAIDWAASGQEARARADQKRGVRCTYYM